MAAAERFAQMSDFPLAPRAPSGDQGMLRSLFEIRSSIDLGGGRKHWV
jgi:hypothetical protein